MSFNPSAKESSGIKYELSPEGPTIARCARVIEIGNQESKYGTQQKCVVVFSLPSYKLEIGGEMKQKFISQPFGINMTNNEKSTMAQYVKALNPRADSLGDFLEKPCQLSIAHFNRKDGKGQGERIDSVTAILPGLDVDELDTEPFWFQWNNPDPRIWAMIPPFTQNLIKQATNYPGSDIEAIAKAHEANQPSSQNEDF